MKLSYIIAAYRAEKIIKLQKNIRDAKILAQYRWLQGDAVICPHLNSANFDGLVPDENFLQAYKEILLKCDCIFVHPNHKFSSGSLEEIKLAEKHKKEIVKYSWEDLIKIKTIVIYNINK